LRALLLFPVVLTADCGRKTTDKAVFIQKRNRRHRAEEEIDTFLKSQGLSPQS